MTDGWTVPSPHDTGRRMAHDLWCCGYLLGRLADLGGQRWFHASTECRDLYYHPVDVLRKLDELTSEMVADGEDVPRAWGELRRAAVEVVDCFVAGQLQLPHRNPRYVALETCLRASAVELVGLGVSDDPAVAMLAAGCNLDLAFGVALHLTDTAPMDPAKVQQCAQIGRDWSGTAVELCETINAL